MAQNISLPIYKTSYDVLMAFFLQLSAKFSRELKFTLGEKMKNETVELLVDICKINKTEKIDEELFCLAFDKVERIKIYLRIAKDLKKNKFGKIC